MSGPSSLRVAFDFCAASRRACRSALPIAGNSRSMMNLRMGPPSGMASPTKQNYRPAVKRGITFSAKSRIEACAAASGIMLKLTCKRGVLEAAELLPAASDRRDDLVRRAYPGGAARDLVIGRRLAQLVDHPVVARIIGRGAAIEPIAGGLDQGMQIGVEQWAGHRAGMRPIRIAEHMKGEHDLAFPRMPGLLPGRAVGAEPF